MLSNTKRISVKFESNIFQTLRLFLLQNEVEQFCFLFCHTSISDEQIIVLPRKIIAFENDKDFVQQHQAGICIDESLVNEAYIRVIESDYTAIINCHSHPFEDGDVWFSSVDDQSDIYHTEYVLSKLSKAKEKFQNNSDILYLSMVFGQKTLGARYYDLKKKQFNAIDKIIVLSEPVQYISPTDNKKKESISESDREIFARQILAFGEAGQKIFSDLTVSVVGVGGVGSIIVEGLCRLGVKKFVLIDPDKIELSNLNRFQGAVFDDIGEHKVKVCKRNIKKMFPDIIVTSIKETLFTEKAVIALKNTDCLIGCTDNEETRYFLNRLSLQFLIPYIDGGVVIGSDGKNVSGLNARLAVVIPGITRCLNCSGIQYYDENKVREYFLDSETRKTLKNSGYIKDFEEITAPAVYPLNLSISSFMLFEILNLFTGYKPVYWNLVLDYLDLNSNIKKCLNTIDDFEPSTKNCLTCEFYKATGDYESLSYFLKRNRNISLPEI